MNQTVCVKILFALVYLFEKRWPFVSTVCRYVIKGRVSFYSLYTRDSSVQSVVSLMLIHLR
jgi:hypothetical protein